MAWIDERVLERQRKREAGLRAALVHDEELLRQQERRVEEQKLLRVESDHRMLNGLQMIMSMLMLQSRKVSNVEISSQLVVAADRIAAIGRVHRRLHCLDGTRTVAFKQYLDDFCRDFEAMLPPGEGQEPSIVVEGDELDLPTSIGIPLGFIVNELIMNAAKYGRGRISVRLEPEPEEGFALSVADEGPGLPDGFDPAAGKGLGMKIIRSLIDQIGGELRIGPGDGGRGTCFTVLFAFSPGRAAAVDCEATVEPAIGGMPGPIQAESNS
jgi:two-component sensor histidine kinase